MVRRRTSVDPAADAAATIDLDAILDELDERWQYRTYSWSLLSAVLLLASVPLLSYMFTAGQLNHRCRVPHCDAADDSMTPADFRPSWLTNAVPRISDDPTVFSPCERFAYVGDGGSCANRSVFDQSLVERCSSIVYETAERTIGREVRVNTKYLFVETENVPSFVICVYPPDPHTPSSTSPAPMTPTSGWPSSARSTTRPAACCCRCARPLPTASVAGPFCSPIWR